MKPDEKTRELLRNITVEIGAGMVLLPRWPAEHAWNGASDRARKIVQNYAEGCGLFQVTRDLASKQEKVNARGEAPNARLPDPSAVSAPAESGLADFEAFIRRGMATQDAVDSAVSAPASTPKPGTRALDSTPGRSVRKSRSTRRKPR